MQGETDKSTTLVGDFNISLSEIDKSDRQNINKDIGELNSTISQLDKIGIYRLLHPTTEYTFFSTLHGIFMNIDHVLDHKAWLDIFKRVEIIHCMLSDHNRIKQEINNRKIEIFKILWN